MSSDSDTEIEVSEIGRSYKIGNVRGVLISSFTLPRLVPTPMFWLPQAAVFNVNSIANKVLL